MLGEEAADTGIGEIGIVNGVEIVVAGGKRGGSEGEEVIDGRDPTFPRLLTRPCFDIIDGDLGDCTFLVIDTLLHYL